MNAKRRHKTDSPSNCPKLSDVVASDDPQEAAAWAEWLNDCGGLEDLGDDIFNE